jgi:transcriptional regulator with XRE-family HTH domain
MANSTLKILREINNYTQEFIAGDILGISQNTYSRLEANPQKLTAEQAQKLSKFYKVAVADLVSDTMPMLFFKDAMKNNSGENEEAQTSHQHLSEKEFLFLKEELDYFKKQNMELLRLLGERMNEA